MLSEKLRMQWSSLGAPRRDGAALGFGLAFLIFGSAGLVRGVGGDVHATWLYPLALIALGVAGLVSVLPHARR